MPQVSQSSTVPGLVTKLWLCLSPWPGPLSPTFSPAPVGPVRNRERDTHTQRHVSLPGLLSLQGRVPVSLLGNEFSQTNQASQQTGDQNNKERLRNPDRGKEATRSLSPGRGAVKWGQPVGQSLFGRDYFCPVWGVGADEIPTAFTKTLSPPCGSDSLSLNSSLRAWSRTPPPPRKRQKHTASGTRWRGGREGP